MDKKSLKNWLAWIMCTSGGNMSTRGLLFQYKNYTKRVDLVQSRLYHYHLTEM